MHYKKTNDKLIHISKIGAKIAGTVNVFNEMQELWG